ncbi:stage V sporulation protein S [Paenibacillus sp. MB22_1]|uniref:stage V sporulation protein S n=1 Tax=Paenibacillus sp. MB22_1 TaxID=3383121 RepID=UPI00208C73ED|nr:stage V sporulation protein S [Paenibacillus sp. HMSSN-139]
MSENVFKVSSKSSVNALAGAVAGVIRDGRDGKVKLELQAVGAAAVNQALKAVAVARGYVSSQGINLTCIPAFVDVVIEGKQRTAMKLIVESGSN